MKIKELQKGQEVIINTYKYSYLGVIKVKKEGYLEQVIGFQGIDIDDLKTFDLHVGNKDLKDVNGNWVIK